MGKSRASFFFNAYVPKHLGIAFLVTALFCPVDCRADNVTLAWDASPDPVTSYTVFYGEQSVLANPSTPKPVGTALQCTIPGLLPGHTYYFALKTSYYNNESGFSNQITYTVPVAGATTTSAVSTSSIATSSVLTTSSTTSTIATTTSILPTTSSTSSALTTSSTTSTIPTTTSTLPATSSTSAASTTSTTANMDVTKKYVMGGKGPSPLEGGAPAVKSEQTALAATHPAFTDQGAIAIFNDSDVAATDPAFTDQGAIVIFDDSDIAAQLSVGWDEYNDLNGEARIATGDIDGDKKDEIIIGLGPVEGNAAIPGGKFQILDDDFTSLGWGQIDWSGYNSINGESWPACGDIDGDGVDEILIGLGVGGDGRVEVFKFKNGQAVHENWIKVGWEEYCMAGGGVRPACGNIDVDRKEEIIFGLYPVNDVFLPEGKFEVLDGSAKHLAWGVVDWPEYNAINGETRPVCGDINRTVRDEILLGLGPGSGGRIPVYSYALGTVKLKTWLQAGTPDYRAENGETRLACGDMDNDGLDEILIGFGQGGKGLMELHDDGLHDFSILSRLLIPDENYNIVNGETYPAIKDTKSDYSRIINLFLKSLSNKRPKQP